MFSQNTSSLFGNRQQNTGGGGLFGGGGGGNSGMGGGGGGGLFGSSGGGNSGMGGGGGGGLFGGNQNQNQGGGGLFGGGNQQQGGGLFGGNNQQNKQGGGLFGGGNQQGSGGGGLFGSGNQQQGGGMGSNQGGGLFGGGGSSGMGMGGGMGNQNRGGLFGSSGGMGQNQGGGGLFGGNQNQNQGGGMLGMLGGGNQSKGSFTHSYNINQLPKNKENITLVSITNLNAFKGKTLEEIRIEDFYAGKNNQIPDNIKSQLQAQWQRNQQGGGMSGLGNQSGGMGSMGGGGGLFGGNQNQNQGGGGLFGGGNQQQGGGMGSNQGGGGLFGGGNQQQGGGLFGGNTQQNKQGGGLFGGGNQQGSGGGGLFGGGNQQQGGGGLFGNKQQGSGGGGLFGGGNQQGSGGGGLFGGGNQQQGGGMGSNQGGGGLFGSGNQQQGGGLFGGNNQQNKQGGGLFGGGNQQGSGGGGLFGSGNQQQGGGLFGGQNKTGTGTGGGLFGGGNQQQGGGLFGGQNKTGTGTTGGGLFGGGGNTSGGGGGLFGGQNKTGTGTGGGLFGGGATGTGGGGLFGGAGAGATGGATGGNQAPQEIQQLLASAGVDMQQYQLYEQLNKLRPTAQTNYSLFGKTVSGQNPADLVTKYETGRDSLLSSIVKRNPRIDYNPFDRGYTPRKDYAELSSDLDARASRNKAMLSKRKEEPVSLLGRKPRVEHWDQDIPLPPGQREVNKKMMISSYIEDRKTEKKIQDISRVQDEVRLMVYFSQGEEERAFSVEAKTSSTCLNIKTYILNQIYETNFLNFSKYKLLYKNKILSDNQCVGDIGFKDNDKVYLILDPEASEETPDEINGYIGGKDQFASEDLLPKLTKNYHTEPSIVKLNRMSENELRAIQHFSIYNEYVKLTFEGKTDLTGLDLDEIVVLGHRSVEVYPENCSIPLPEAGRGLNKAATIEFYQWSLPKKYIQNVEAYRAKMEDWANSQNAQFLYYDPDREVLCIRVRDFNLKP